MVSSAQVRLSTDAKAAVILHSYGRGGGLPNSVRLKLTANPRITLCPQGNPQRNDGGKFGLGRMWRILRQIPGEDGILSEKFLLSTNGKNLRRAPHGENKTTPTLAQHWATFNSPSGA